MRKMYNERHIRKEEMATNLDVLRELDKRGVLDNELSRELERLEAKNKGLEVLMNQLNKYAKNHWMYMIDVSMDHYNILNCDVLLLTSTSLYTFEINHYEGLFEFKSGESSLNGKKLEQYPIKMAQSISSQLKSLATMNSIPLNIRGVAVFTNPKNKVQIYDEINDIEIVDAEQLETFIKNIIREENEQKNRSKINPMYISWMAKIDRHHPSWLIKIPDEIKEKLRLGIACSACEHFDVEVGEDCVSCLCGKRELLEEAIVRTICDYGVLNNEKDLYPPDLHLFFDKQVSIEKIEKCLTKYFTPVR